eukprot:SAG31_NODE_4046_length_3639_cov_19.403390_5_plen_75_part_00
MPDPLEVQPHDDLKTHRAKKLLRDERTARAMSARRRGLHALEAGEYAEAKRAYAVAAQIDPSAANTAEVSKMLV